MRGGASRPTAPPFLGPHQGEVLGPCSQPGRGPARPSGLGCQEGGPRRSRAGSGRGGRGAGAPRPRLRRALPRALLRGGIIEPRGRGPALAVEALLELGARAARVPRPEPRAAPRAPRLCPPAARRPWSAPSRRAGSRCRCCCSAASRCWRPKVGARGRAGRGGSSPSPRPPR